MPLTQRPFSINCYCLSKIWFRCASLPLRACDFSTITSSLKSWIYADQLEKPNELALYRPRKHGGLALINVQFKSLSLLIRTFLEMAVVPKYKHNQYHVALYRWFVEEDRSICRPVLPPYYNEEFFNCIKEVVREGILNVRSLSSGQWYRLLLEKHVICELKNQRLVFRSLKVELAFPLVNWELSWLFAVLKGLPSENMAFLWRMMHDILPTQSRLFRMKVANAVSDKCLLCQENAVGDIAHCLMLCAYNDGVGKLVTDFLSKFNSNLEPRQVVHLNFEVGENPLPPIFFVSTVLLEVWSCRKEKKPIRLYNIRATLEAKINILRKSRHIAAAEILLDYLQN